MQQHIDQATILAERINTVTRRIQSVCDKLAGQAPEDPEKLPETVRGAPPLLLALSDALGTGTVNLNRLVTQVDRLEYALGLDGSPSTSAALGSMKLAETATRMF